MSNLYNRTPEDSGAADSYYMRGAFPKMTRNGVVIREEDMTAEEVDEYMDGFMKNEEEGDFKRFDWKRARRRKRRLAFNLN